MIKVKQFCFNPFAESAFVISDTESGQAIAVDPGMLDVREQQALDYYISVNQLSLTQVVNTHLHLDHCFGDNYVRSKYGVKVAAHPDDAFLGKTLTEQAARFGIPASMVSDVEIDVPLKDGDTISVGQYNLHVLHVPGHSPGSIALYSPEGNFLISGDALFKHSIGRTDLPGGSLDTLLASINNKLLTLPDQTQVLPGHYEFTTIGEEKKFNPYIK